MTGLEALDKVLDICEELKQEAKLRNLPDAYLGVSRVDIAVKGLIKGLILEEENEEDEYRWHDLSKKPNDLPCPWEYVLITNYKNEVYVAMIDSNHNAWALRDDEFDYCDIGSFMVKAWKEIEPFEVE